MSVYERMIDRLQSGQWTKDPRGCLLATADSCRDDRDGRTWNESPIMADVIRRLAAVVPDVGEPEPEVGSFFATDLLLTERWRVQSWNDHPLTTLADAIAAVVRAANVGEPAFDVESADTP